MLINYQRQLYRMRVALCLHGLSGGQNSKGRVIRAEDGFHGFKKHLLKAGTGYQIDVFMHSWTPSAEAKMVKLYKPKKWLFEPQKEFEGPPKGTKFEATYYRNMYSLYYSYKMVNKLKRKYEEDENFKYDWVIHSRFDLNLTKFEIKLEELEKDKIYFIGWQEKRLLDHFWLTSSELMDQFIEVYKFISEYEAELKRCGSNSQYLNHDVIFIHAKRKGLLPRLRMLGNNFKGGTFPMKSK